MSYKFNLKISATNPFDRSSEHKILNIYAMTTNYSHEFKKFFGVTRLSAKICGVDAVSEDYRMTWIAWSLIVLINGAVLFTFYTVHVAITVNNEWIDVIKCLCMFCTGIQGYAKLINIVKRPQMLSSIHREVFNIYVVFEKKTHNYQQLLDESLKLIKKLILVLVAIYSFTGLSVIVIPLFYKMVFNQHIFVMPFFLPYVDFETDFGYYFTSAFHVVCVFFGAVGNFISDSWCFVFAAHIPLIKNILLAKFKELDEITLRELATEKMKIDELLLDILKWHQKYIGFCNRVKVLFFWVIFVQVVMEFVSIVCTIVCIFLGVWPASPIFLIYSLAVFYFHCALGNLVELSNDDVTTMIYDSRWYNLTVSQQRMILIMLRESQQAEGMSIGGIAPLTMHTALQMTKRIYSFSMILRKFLD